jgi:hypothetical protein
MYNGHAMENRAQGNLTWVEQVTEENASLSSSNCQKTINQQDSAVEDEHLNPTNVISQTNLISQTN